MAVGGSLEGQPVLATIPLRVPPQSAIELAIDLVTVLDGGIAHLARLGALKIDLMISAKPFQHGIKALTRPG